MRGKKKEKENKYFRVRGQEEQEMALEIYTGLAPAQESRRSPLTDGQRLHVPF